MGLVALTRIARNRVSRKTRRYYASIEKMWTSARTSLEQKGATPPDFSPVQNAEPNMRGQFLKLMWTSTKRYGNREFKRVYSWLEGTVGPFNALLNYAGARLRDIAMTLYPFPRPQAFQIREYPDGSKRVLTKTEADNPIDDGAINHGFCPTYFLTLFEESHCVSPSDLRIARVLWHVHSQLQTLKPEEAYCKEAVMS
jgi:hypothetical protein